jgi:hypothetical protein
MARNMGTFDRALRAVVVAPVAVVVAFILGAGTLGGIILFVSTDPRLHRVGHRLRGGHA